MIAYSINTVESYPLLKSREDGGHATLRKTYNALLGEFNRILFRGYYASVEHVFERLDEGENDALIYSDDVREEYIIWQWKRYFETLLNIMPDKIDEGVSFYSLVNEVQQEPLDRHLKSYRSIFMMYDLVVNFHSVYSFFYDVTYHENDAFHQHVMRAATYMGLEWKDVAISFSKKIKEWIKGCKRIQKYDDLLDLERPMTELEERGIRMADYAYKGKVSRGLYRPTLLSPVAFPILPWRKHSSTCFDMNYGLRGALFMVSKDKLSKDMPTNAVYLLFSGTQFDNWDNLKTDISQFLYSDAVYYAALALKLEINQDRTKNNISTLVVGGHSLGGGLAQFAVGACKDKSGLIGLGYNAAGLSNFFFSKVKSKKTSHFTHIFVKNDPIHKWGNQIGRCLELPSHGWYSHGICALDDYIGERYYCEI